MKTKIAPKIAEGTNELNWRVNTVGLFKEVLSNSETQILKVPLQIMTSLLALVAKRASEINDPELNKLMLRLALYAVGDPYTKEYDQKLYDKTMKVSNDKDINLRANAPETAKERDSLKKALNDVLAATAWHRIGSSALINAQKILGINPK